MMGRETNTYPEIARWLLNFTCKGASIQTSQLMSRINTFQRIGLWHYGRFYRKPLLLGPCEAQKYGIFRPPEAGETGPEDGGDGWGCGNRGGGRKSWEIT
jgi:hypothetical protein